MVIRKLILVVDGKRQFVNNPPLVERLSDLVSDEQKAQVTRQYLEHDWFAYINGLPEERRLLLECFQATDAAFRVACGICLARAHARTGDSAWISGYLGSETVFDDAIGDFAVAYANQTECDYQLLVGAFNAGQILAETGI